MWLIDPKTKEPSVTLTAFVVGFLIAAGKLLISGLSIKGFTLTPFSGGDFAAVVGSVGAIYWARRNTADTDTK